MGGKIIVHNAKSAYVTPLDVYINGQKIGHVKNNGIGEFPISGDCELSVRCGINLQRPKVTVCGNYITEVQFKVAPVTGKFSLEVVSQYTAEEEEARRKREYEAAMWENRERRMRCNVCGHVFCYTVEDLKKNAGNASMGAISAVGSLASVLGGGTIFHTHHLQGQADRYTDKIIDYNRCPSCHSTNITEMTGSEGIQQPNPTPAPTVSSVEEIKKYKELLDMGIITQQEFDAKKKQLLGL